MVLQINHTHEMAIRESYFFLLGLNQNLIKNVNLIERRSGSMVSVVDSQLKISFRSTDSIPVGHFFARLYKIL